MQSPTFEDIVSVGPTWPVAMRVARAAALTPPLLLLMLYCWYRWRYRRVLLAARKMPSAAPTLKVIADCRKSRVGFVDLVTFMINTCKASVARGMRTVCMWVGPYPVVVVQGADDAKTILANSKTEKSREYGYIKFALGNGLLTCPADVHRVTRRYMDPVLQPKNLTQMTAVFNASSRTLTSRLAALEGGGQQDIMPAVTPVVFLNICNILFGPSIHIDMESEDFLGVIKAMKILNKLELNRFFKLWLWPDPIFYFLWRKEIKTVMELWSKFADGPLKNVVESEIAFLNENNNKTGVEDSTTNKNVTFTASGRYREMQARHPEFSKKDFEQEMFTLIITGAETTRTVICSCLFSLAADPDIQERLFDEIVSVAGVQDKDVTLEQLNRMPYLDQVFKETIRKFSVVPLFMRKALEDIHLSECVVPEGATVAISLISLQFDPLAFPDPERFDPSRFAPENVNSINKFNYIPFSAGSRNCIGKWYAAQTVKTAVVHALRRYRVTTDRDPSAIRFHWGLAMTSYDGYHLQLHPRTT